MWLFLLVQVWVKMNNGKLVPENKLVMAPIADVSDEPYRTIAKEYGAGLTFTQMVSAEGVIENNFQSLRLSAFNRDEKPIGVQLLGKDPAILGEAVRELSKFKPDVIDLNCGCPVDKVCKYGFGAGLLDNPALLGTLVKSMVDNSKGIPISVKVRLGKSKINVLENAKVIEDNGASIITIHARKRLDKYDTLPDYQWIRSVKEYTNLAVWGNGSVFNPEDAVELKKQTGCDGIMVARGALGNPFIFKRFSTLIQKGYDPGEPGITEVRDLALRHIEMLSRAYNEIVAVDRAKKNVIWYFRRFKGIEILLDKIFSVKSIAGLKEFVQEHSEKIEQEKFNIDKRMEIENMFKRRVSFWLYDSFNTLQIVG